MDAGEARHLKHELRTPMNHLVGYSALLIETARDNGDTSFAEHADDIHALAQELNRTIESLLVGGQENAVPPNLQRVGETLAPLVDRFAMKLLPATAVRDQNGYEEDLHKMRGATERLQSLLQRLRCSGETDPLTCRQDPA